VLTHTLSVEVARTMVRFRRNQGSNEDDGDESDTPSGFGDSEMSFSDDDGSSIASEPGLAAPNASAKVASQLFDAHAAAAAATAAMEQAQSLAAAAEEEGAGYIDVGASDSDGDDRT
jgi:hypothetical protein